jgi:hypothetical protein
MLDAAVAELQKSGLSAARNPVSLPCNVFGADRHSVSDGRRYVMVADQGVVKTPSSSTVN